MVVEEGLQHGNTMVTTLECSTKDKAVALFTTLSVGAPLDIPLRNNLGGPLVTSGTNSV
jgi:hypothetical protein